MLISISAEVTFKRWVNLAAQYFVFNMNTAFYEMGALAAWLERGSLTSLGFHQEWKKKTTPLNTFCYISSGNLNVPWDTGLFHILVRKVGPGRLISSCLTVSASADAYMYFPVVSEYFHSLPCGPSEVRYSCFSCNAGDILRQKVQGPNT